MPYIKELAWIRTRLYGSGFVFTMSPGAPWKGKSLPPPRYHSLSTINDEKDWVTEFRTSLGVNDEVINSIFRNIMHGTTLESEQKEEDGVYEDGTSWHIPSHSQVVTNGDIQFANIQYEHRAREHVKKLETKTGRLSLRHKQPIIPCILPQDLDESSSSSSRSKTKKKRRHHRSSSSGPMTRAMKKQRVGLVDPPPIRPIRPVNQDAPRCTCMNECLGHRNSTRYTLPVGKWKKVRNQDEGFSAQWCLFPCSAIPSRWAQDTKDLLPIPGWMSVMKEYCKKYQDKYPNSKEDTTTPDTLRWGGSTMLTDTVLMKIASYAPPAQTPKKVNRPFIDIVDICYSSEHGGVDIDGVHLDVRFVLLLDWYCLQLYLHSWWFVGQIYS